MSYGDDAGAIISKDITILLAQAKGRHDFVPRGISGTAGKRCTVTSLVKDETYDYENEGLMIFEVKKAELIDQLTLTETSSSQQATRASKEASTLTATLTDMPSLPENTVCTENTPVKDVIDRMATEAEEDSPSEVNDEKRKFGTSTITESKKQRKGHDTNRKVIFDSDQ